MLKTEQKIKPVSYTPEGWAEKRKEGYRRPKPTIKVYRYQGKWYSTQQQFMKLLKEGEGVECCVCSRTKEGLTELLNSLT